ncbi:MAG: 3-dehydroquinate synthase [Sulfitobacter sp.]
MKQLDHSHASRPFSTSWRWLLIFVLLITALVVPFLLFETQIEKLANQVLSASPSAAQLIALIGGALAFDVILPVPSSIVNAAAGAALGFVVGTLVCWFGMTLGCLFGYWIGSTGGTSLVRRLLGPDELDRAKGIARSMGIPALITMRAVPVLAEASTIAAGAARLPIAKFLPTVAIANLGIAAVYAGIGAFAWSANSFLLALAGAIGVPVVAYALLRVTARWTGVSTPVAASALSNPTRQTTQAFSIDHSYEVAFTRGLFQQHNPTLAQVLTTNNNGPARCVVFLDSGVAGTNTALLHQIESYFASNKNDIQLLEAPQIVPGGETIKDGLAQISAIYEILQRNGVDRHAYVIAIGGGAVLDAVGFAAATAHRGIRHIRVPTTVLSQNDSGVGVKNAVNFNGVKNYVGTFASPAAVLNDFDFLAALPNRERIAGLSEALKVALIRDADFFQWQVSNADALVSFDPSAEEHMVRRSAELHMHQILNSGDPFESGSARPLDFGHWSAHRLESLSNHAISHGEAVAIGIALDARYSVLAGLLTESENDQIIALLDRLGLPTWHPLLEQKNAHGTYAVLRGLHDFQEHLGGELTITLLQGIGQGREVHEMDYDLVVQAIGWLKDRKAA